MRTLHHQSERRAGWTVAELLTSLTICSVLTAGLIVGAFTIQRSFQSSHHHVKAQAQQLLLMDYINLDLRRALKVTPESSQLSIQIPDYYDSTGQPRDPKLDRGSAVYGPVPVSIRYFREGTTIFREVQGVRTALAEEVSDFRLSIQDLGQSIGVSVTFLPRFKISGKNLEDGRAGTATYCTTLLRNKRQN